MTVENLKQNRVELKYLMRWETYQGILRDVTHLTESDSHTDSDGKYSIVSLYYDSPDYRFYWEKIQGLPTRCKVRIRQYGQSQDGDQGYIEIKGKQYFSIQKQRVLLKLADAYRLLESPFDRGDCNDTDFPMVDAAVLKRILYLRDLYDLRPQIIVSYDRHALVGRFDQGLRLTFDTNLRARTESLRLEDGVWGEYICGPEFVVGEFKVDSRIPEWLISIIGSYNLEPQRVSKYCLGLERALQLQSQLLY